MIVDVGSLVNRFRRFSNCSHCSGLYLYEKKNKLYGYFWSVIYSSNCIFLLDFFARRGFFERLRPVVNDCGLAIFLKE
jgi:hypothetical protein